MKITELYKHPESQAEEMGLHYTTDEAPGISRLKKGKHFIYKNIAGKIISDAKTIERINKLAIPPAYKNVWICPSPNGHLQATGIDSRGRKQYRYHPKWRKVRDETKYGRMMAFAKSLPKIRARVKKDLKLPELTKEKVLAAVVTLLEKTLIRIGNEEYAKDNQSYGLTTMRDKHVSVRKGTIHFEFKGKSGVYHTVDLHDKKLSKIIKQCKDIPGFELFQYYGEDGQRRSVRSEDVNTYLQTITGRDFTAKDFRTWYGTVLAAEALKAFTEFDSEAQKKKNLISAIESVAKDLGNTKAVCRKCYIHPAIIDSYMEGSLITELEKNIKDTIEKKSSFSGPEVAVMALLGRKLRNK